MKKIRLSSEELLEVLNTQWATANDVKLIGCVGQNKALEIMKEIRTKIENDGYYLPRNLVPMEKVIEYFKININYLKKMIAVQGGKYEK